MKKFSFFLIAAIAVLGCSKSSSTTNTPPAITVQNIAGNYKITSITVAGQDIFTQSVPVCEQDDIYNIKADNTYDVEDAGMPCNPTSATTGVWTLSGKQMALGPQLFTIVSLTTKVLEVTTTEVVSGQSVTATITFTRQ
jgi:hypothetical protein